MDEDNLFSVEHHLLLQLLQAVIKGDVEAVKPLFDGIDTSELKKFCDKRDCSLLHIAAKNGQNDIVKLLLDKLDVNSQTNWKKETALMLAIKNNNDETVELLFNHGADINIPKIQVYTELFQIACVNGRIKMVKVLLEHGVRLYSNLESSRSGISWFNREVRQTLQSIIKDEFIDGQQKILEMLLSYETEDNKLKVYEAVLKMLIKLSKDIETLEKFLSLGEESWENHIINKGLTYSSGSGSIRLAQFFLDKGADINYFNQSDCPLRQAFENKREHAFLFLLDNGADLQGVQFDICRIFEWALKCKNECILKSLLNNGADINDLERSSKTRPTIRPFRIPLLHRELPSSVLGNSYDLDISKVVVRHMVDLQEQGKHVNPRLVGKIAFNSQLSKDFKEKCEDEMKLIKGLEKIDNTTVSLYEVWRTNDLMQLTAYMQNEHIVKFLKSEDFEKKFPIYSEVMRMKFTKGFDRIHLQKRVCNFFLNLATREEHRLPKLPVTCAAKIFNDLSNRDLCNLRNAYY